MKRKTIAVTYILILSFATIIHLYIPKTEVVAEKFTVIPSEAIRLRILANSDRAEDQVIKQKVRDAVNEQITVWVEELTSLGDARKLLNERLPEIQLIAESIAEQEGFNQSVAVEFSKVQFPTKLYGQFLYPAGEYEAILITLGEGKGANWWCVLFPPLCFLDFSNGVAVSDGFEEGTRDHDEASNGALTQQKKQEKTKNTANVTSTDTVGNEELKVPNMKSGTDGIEEEKAAEDTESAQDTKKADVLRDKEKMESQRNKVEITHKKDLEAPVYAERDEEPVKVKFFIVELFHKLFKS